MIFDIFSTKNDLNSYWYFNIGTSDLQQIH